MQPWRPTTGCSTCRCRRPHNCNRAQQLGRRDPNPYYHRYSPYAQSTRTYRHDSTNPNRISNFSNHLEHIQHENNLSENEHVDENSHRSQNEDNQREQNQHVNDQYGEQENSSCPNYQNNQSEIYYFNNDLLDYYNEFRDIPSYVVFRNPSNPLSLVYYGLMGEYIFVDAEDQ